MLDEPWLIPVLLALVGATTILCLVLLLSARIEPTHARESKPLPTEWAKCWLAETLGTFALVFIGMLSISAPALANITDTSTNWVAAALAHGLTIAVMIAALGAVSGGHFNPAVTFGFILTGRLDPLKGLLYWSAQLAGSIGAAYLIAGLFGPTAVTAATPDLAKDVNLFAGMALEAVMTFFLVLVVFGTAVDRRAHKNLSSLAIGFTVALGMLAIGPLTGAALNPARAFGPALAGNHWQNHLIYWVGPMVGGSLGALVQHFLLMETTLTTRLSEATILRRPAERYADELAAKY